MRSSKEKSRTPRLNTGIYQHLDVKFSFKETEKVHPLRRERTEHLAWKPDSERDSQAQGVMDQAK